MKHKRGIILLFATLLTSFRGMTAQNWAGIVDPSRAENWQRANVGVKGGIPSPIYTQCNTAACNGIVSAGSASTASQINAALASAPSNTYVYLPAGTYNNLGNTGICLGSVCGNKVNANVALRGAGANATFLVPSSIGFACGNGRSANICIGDSSIFPGGNNTMPPCGLSGSSNCANWTNGFSLGATAITLTNVGSAGILNGDYIVIDQGNSTSDTGGYLICSQAVGSSFACSQNGATGNGRFSGGFEADHQQWVQVTGGCSSICTGSGPFALTITPGLYDNDWNRSQPVFGVWFPGHNVVGYKGVEDLSIDDNSAGSQGNFSFYNCPNCWLENVRSMNSLRSHATVFLSPRVEIRDSYFYSTQHASNQSYGIEYGEPAGSDQLFENNIFQQISSPLVGGGASGTVVGYNFAIDDYYGESYTYLQLPYHNHDADNVFQLWEGNVFPSIGCDADHGSGGINTLFRNWLNGLDWNTAAGSATHPTQQTVAVDLDAYCRGANVLGNVLGTPSYHNHYTTEAGDSLAKVNTSIYILGWANGSLGSYPGMSNDPQVAASILRWGNYDVVTGAVRWCGNSTDPGWSTVCGGVSEIPTAGLPYINGNPVPSNTTLPPSFYYESTPTWWGTMPYPPIGPDVTAGNAGFFTSGTYSGGICQVGNGGGGASCQSVIGGHANVTPAMNCYFNVMSGPYDGSGPALTYDASLCYSLSGGQGPLPPQGLQAIVN